MKIAIGCDHGGYELKEKIKVIFEAKGHSFVDMGTNSADSVDYPLYGFKVGEAVASGECEKGIVICSSGVGISIAANKVKGIRCALCTDSYCAKMSVRHNNANVVAMGAKIVGVAIAEEIVDAFLSETFEGGRHERRVDMIDAYNN